MKNYWKPKWKMWLISLVISMPMAAVLIYGGWSMTRPHELPIWTWLYVLAGGCLLVYIEAKYFRP